MSWYKHKVRPAFANSHCRDTGRQIGRIMS